MAAQTLLSYMKDGNEAARWILYITLEDLVCNVFVRQVRGRHGRAGLKLLFLASILMCFHIVILVCSYRGYYCGLSIHLREFDSPTDRQILRATSPGYFAPILNDSNLRPLGDWRLLGPATVALPYLLDSSIG